MSCYILCRIMSYLHLLIVAIISGQVLCEYPPEEVPVGGTIWLNCTEAPPWSTSFKSITYRLLKNGSTNHPTVAAQHKADASSSITILQVPPYEHREIIQDGWGRIGLQQAQNNDSGNYNCSGWNVNGSLGYMTISGRKVVAAPTEPPTAQAPPFVSVTRTATLSCIKNQDMRETVRLLWRRVSPGGTVRGHVNSSTGQLTISGITKGDSGSYVCSYNNVAGSLDSSPVQLVVHYPPEESPRVPSSSVLRYENDSSGINCQISGGLPLANLTWTCPDGSGLTSGSQTDDGYTVTRPLQGKVKGVLHQSSCTCEVQHYSWYDDKLNKTTGVTFIVYYPPGPPSITPTTPLLDGKPQTMTCQSAPGNPASQYRWSPKNGQGETLELTPTKADHQTELSCTVTNNFTVERPGRVEPLVGRLTLNVEYKPMVILQSPANIKENETLWMNCSADSNPAADQDSQFEWTLPSGGKETGRSLGLLNIKNNNTGQYTCTVRVNSQGAHGTLAGSDTTTLTVQYLHMTSASSSATVTEGDPLNISCFADGVPSGTFSPWFHTGKYVGTRQIGKETGNRTIRYSEEHVNYTHTGIYTCRVRNSVVPYQQRDIPVTVRFPPKNETHRPEGEKIFTELGQDVTMEMTVFAYPEQVTFAWFIQSQNASNFTRITEDNKKFRISTNMTNGLVSTLTVVNTTIVELTNYTVSVENGVIKASDFLFLVEPQGCPTEVSIEDTETTAVSLTTRWRPGYNSGLPQTITVKLCNMTTNKCDVKEAHEDPGYNQPMITQWLGLLDNSCYNIRMEAYNDYDRDKRGTNEGCTVTTETQECTKVIPVVEKGKFQVVYKGSTADLSWSLPSNPNSYTRQEIEQQKLANRRRREVKVCDPPSCHRVPKGQTNLTVSTEQGVRYSFTLVLYDGEVPVYSVPATVAAAPEPTGPPSSVGAIAGGVAGGLLAVIVIVIVVIVFLRRKQILGKGGSDGWLMRKSKDRNGGTTNPAFSDTEAHGNSEGAGPYSEVGSSQTSLAHAGPVDDGTQLYAQPDKGKKNKKKQQGAAGGAAAAPELYAEVNKKGKKAAQAEGPVLYAEVNKKGKAPTGDVYAEVQKGKKKDEQPEVYAEVNKKGGKKDKKDKKKGKKGKDEPEPTLYENIPKNTKGQKKKAVGPTGTEYEDVRGAYANMSRGAAGGLPEDEGAYSEVQARLNPDTEITSPPPGSDGLTYMELEIIKKPRDSAPKPVIAPKPDATVYADIDLTRRVDPLPPDPPPSGDNKDKGQGQ